MSKTIYRKKRLFCWLSGINAPLKEKVEMVRAIVMRKDNV